MKHTKIIMACVVFIVILFGFSYYKEAHAGFSSGGRGYGGGGYRSSSFSSSRSYSGSRSYSRPSYSYSRPVSRSTVVHHNTTVVNHGGGSSGGFGHGFFGGMLGGMLMNNNHATAAPVVIQQQPGAPVVTPLAAPLAPQAPMVDSQGYPVQQTVVHSESHWGMIIFFILLIFVIIPVIIHLARRAK